MKTLINLTQLLLISQLSFWLSPKLGLIVTGLAILGCLINATFRLASRQAVLGSLIFLTGLFLEYALPIRDLGIRMIILYLTMLGLGLSYLWMLKLKFWPLLLNRKVVGLFLVGLIWGGAICLVLDSQLGVIKDHYRMILILSPVAALTEELILRIFIQAPAQRLVRPWVAIAYTSLSWLIFNLSGNLVFSVSYGLTGLALAYLYAKTNQLSLSLAMNLGIKLGILLFI